MSKKVEKKIDELINMVGNNESVVVIYKDEKDNVNYFDSCKDALDMCFFDEGFKCGQIGFFNIFG